MKAILRQLKIIVLLPAAIATGVLLPAVLKASPAGRSIAIKFGANEDNNVIAGAAGVLATANWNNAREGTGTTNLNYDLNGASGASTASVTWGNGGTRSSGAGSSDDARLMMSWIRPEAVVVSGLDAAFTTSGYKVYLYYMNSAVNKGNTYRIGDNASYTNYWNGITTVSPFNGTFVKDVTQNNLDQVGETPGANYILFTGLAGSSFTISFNSNPDLGLGDDHPICGIEIVANSGVGPVPTQLVFVQQPTGAAAGVVIAPPITVQAKDAIGNNVATAGLSVAMTLSSGTGTLGGTTTRVTDANGLATFNDLTVDQGGAKNLTASSSPLTNAVSNPFNIAPVGAFSISIAPNGSDVTLTWPHGTLLEADAVVGPWATNNAPSPYTLTPAAPQKFYRVIDQ